MNHVQIKTGARLHFGLLCPPPEASWHYGGIGIMVDHPSWEFSIRRQPVSGADVIVCQSPHTRSRTESVLERFRQNARSCPGVTCSFAHEASFHSGLGAGTQLTLALTTALMLLSDQPRPTCSSQIAAALGRSRRSGIGTYGFDHGGFIVDHGQPEAPQSMRKFSRQRMPDSWRFVLLTPLHTTGLSGTPEEAFFNESRFLTGQQLSTATRLITDEILPAVTSEDFSRFRHSLEEYGHMVGTYYAGSQGGVFSDDRIPGILDNLKAHGITGAAQSSWGPTVCFPAESASHAEFVTSVLQAYCEPGLFAVRTTSPLNIGASIRTAAADARLC